MTRDQWFLTGAWATMAAVGSFSLYKVSESPKIDPTISALLAQLEVAQNTGTGHHPEVRRIPQPPPWTQCGPGDPGWHRAGYLSPTEDRSWFRTKFIGIPVPPKPRDILVLPFPVMEAATADLAGVRITWRTEQREVEHPGWMRPKPASPKGFVVLREAVLGQPETVAELGPEARAYADLSAAPRKAYSYWVVLKGLETDRSDSSGAMVPVTNKADRPVSASAPPAVRVKLIGGDKEHAVLRAELYDRAKGAWVSKTVLAAPGGEIDGTGWLLRGMRFDGFTLVADVTDDDGAARVLTTRN